MNQTSILSANCVKKNVFVCSIKINVPSMRSQCPVSTQMHTIDTANEKLNSSAAVKRPQNPSDIRFPSEQGLMMYWHMGRSKNANATVAIIAVHTANSICIESKKKNITNSDTDAPSGRQRACIVSNVANLSVRMEKKRGKKHFNQFEIFFWREIIWIQMELVQPHSNEQRTHTLFRLNRFAG